MPLGGTANWRDYLNIATQRGLPLVMFVQVFDKVGCTSEVPEEVFVEENSIEEHVEGLHRDTQETTEEE